MGYWEVTVRLPEDVTEDVAEGVTNFVWELGAVGVVEEKTPRAAAALRAFFPASAAPATLAAGLRDYLTGLRALGFSVGGEPTVAPLEDEDWAAAWRRHFRPVPVGRSLVVAPPWERPPLDGRLLLTIEPGRAFGTGHHGSTAGCLVLLETLLQRGPLDRAVDLGTGSGILAVAAARLGASAVLAVDEDPDAVAAAVANAAENGVSDRVRGVLADIRALSLDPAPLVLANLLAAAHAGLASRYRQWVRPGGALVLGGILDAEADAVARTVGDHGFALARTVSVEGWTALALTRDAALHDRA